MPTLQKNSISLHYEAVGNREDPCLIFVMGITGQLIDWPKELLQKFAENGFYVITFDNRDVGLSSYFDETESLKVSEALALSDQGKSWKAPYTLNDMASDILILLDGLNIQKAHIIGVSMGGFISQLFALEHPERVLSLTLISTSSGDRDLPPAKKAVLDLFFQPSPITADLKSFINQRMQVWKTYNPPEDIDEAEIKRVSEEAYVRAFHPEGNSRQLLAMISAEPRGKMLSQLQVPTLIIHGDADPVFPLEHANQLAKCIPNSRLEIFEKMGHGLPKRVFPRLVRAMTEHFRAAKS